MTQATTTSTNTPRRAHPAAVRAALRSRKIIGDGSHLALLSISGHPQDDNNGDYLVLSALHQGDQSQSFAFGGSKSVAATAKTYRNELSLIKKDIPYRTPVDANRVPQVHGVFFAKIETTGGDYAYLDDQGRYRLKPMFDVADTKEGEGSHAVRMMQPSAGSNYGVHFPLHAGTEVLIACTNGDPDRPIILGSVANPSTQSPVTSSNASQHTVRTFAGNELMMDDLADSEKINLHTKDQKNFLSLDANSDSHKVALRTEEGRTEVYAKKTMSFESGDSYALQSGNDQTITVENKHSLQTNKKDIAFNAATDIALSAKQNIKLSTEDKDISLTSGQDLIIEAGKTMSVRVMAGDSITTVDQGQLSMNSAQDITILGKGGGPIQISQGSGIIEITKGGDLTIIGTSVEISAATVNINGSAVSLNEGGAAPTVTPMASKAIAAAAAPVASTPQALGAPAAATTLADAAPAKGTRDTGRFITAAEGQKVADVAKKWADAYLPYVSNGRTKKGADCSGSTSSIYAEAGLTYPHHDTATFTTLVGTDLNFVKGKHYFKKVGAPQVGDVGLWNGHMAIYDPNAGKTVPEKLDGNLLSARFGEKPYGPARIYWFDNYVDKKTGKKYGIVKWYRFWKPEGGK